MMHNLEMGYTGSMRTDLLDELLVEEGTAEVRERISGEIAAARADPRVRRCQLDFDRFELVIDVANQLVSVVELLDPDERTELSLAELEKRLERGR